MSHFSRERVAENLASVRARIEDSARRSNRGAGDVRLVAVTKQVAPDIASYLVALGVKDLGESRPQELIRKQSVLGDAVRWHLIGPLQRNKARRMLAITHMIHSIDSLRLLAWLDQLASERGRQSDVLLEVNISGESAKHGFDAREMPGIIEAAAGFVNLRILGLMTMAPYEDNAESARRVFASLRELSTALRRSSPPNCPLNDLSMGMSGDFELAIAEGATIVRVGSALFEKVEPSDD